MASKSSWLVGGKAASRESILPALGVFPVDFLPRGVIVASCDRDTTPPRFTRFSRRPLSVHAPATQGVLRDCTGTQRFDRRLGRSPSHCRASTAVSRVLYGTHADRVDRTSVGLAFHLLRARARFLLKQKQSFLTWGENESENQESARLVPEIPVPAPCLHRARMVLV